MRKVPTSRAPDCTVQKYIGSAYDEVKKVADNIDEVKQAAGLAGEITQVIPHLSDIETCANNIDAIKDAPNQALAASSSAASAKGSETIATNAKDLTLAAESNVQTLAGQVSNDLAQVTIFKDEAKASEVASKASEVASKASETAAAQSAADALHNANLTFISGGIFKLTPVTGEYPDVTSIVRDTIWIVELPNDGSVPKDPDGVPYYTFTVGDLAGKLIKNGWMLFYDTPQNKFQDPIITSFTGIVSINGKSDMHSVINYQDIHGLLDLETNKGTDNLVLRHSNITGSTPTPSELQSAELFINLTDKRIFTKDGAGDIVVVGEANVKGTDIVNPNLLINGDFSVWQRGASGAIATSREYTADRFTLWAAGANTNWSRVSATEFGDFAHDVVWGLRSSPDPASIQSPLQYRMENLDCYNLFGKTVTLSFLMNSTKTQDVNVELATANVFEDFTAITAFHTETVSVGTATQRVAVTAKVTSNDIRNGLSIVVRPSNSGGSSVAYSNFKLELGSVATPFVPDDPATNLAKCQRYYVKGSSTACRLNSSSTFSGGMIRNSYPAHMRISPTVILTKTAGDAPNAGTVPRRDNEGFIHSPDGNWAVNHYADCIYTADAEL